MAAPAMSWSANRQGAVCGFFLFITVVSAALFAAGCAPRDLSSLPPGLDARGHYISGVPFVPQGADDCGPAALSGVLAFHGADIPLDEIRSRILTPALRGTLPPDMENFARTAGFSTDAGSGTLDRLHAEVRSGRPVICLLDLGSGLYRQPHYVVAIGFDDVHRIMIMHDGATKNRLMAYDRFQKAWGRAGNWMLAVHPRSASSSLPARMAE